MLNSIAWEQYFIFIAFALFLYYLGILFLYYRKDLISKLSSGRSTSSVYATDPNSNSFSPKASSFMGSIKQEEREDKIQSKHKEIGEAEKLEVGAITTDSESPVDEEPPLPSPEILLLGSIADLLKEIKSLIPLLSENDGCNADFKTLLSALFAKNPQLKSTTYQDAISLFIYNEYVSNLPFELGLQEIKNCWNESKTT